jgi:L,D-transpeptidase catalytic domain
MGFVTRTAAHGPVLHGMRKSRIVMAAMVVLQLACGGCQTTPQPVASGSTAQAFDELSPQEQNAGQIATQNGDRDYLMVDKAHGRIRLFESGAVVFTAPALTGENKSDRLPPDTLAKDFDRLGAFGDKVTPAGRFTVSQDYDNEYGTVFEINEIQGPDWTIAIHQVYLGTPSERRSDRLESKRHDDKHITHGCINVTRETIQRLVEKLPQGRPTALYILPYDQSQTTSLLTKRG